jgi:serine/threonine-protein kinase
LTRETLARLTSDAAVHNEPVWSADGRRIAFASTSPSRPTRMEWRPADGSGMTARILTSALNQVPSAFHPSGRFLAFEEFSTELDIDLKALPIEGSEADGWTFGTPFPISSGPARETTAAFSPDGRWVAFLSNETGRPEVYVRPFPALNARWQLSNNSGWAPVFSRARPEIIYNDSDGSLMVAAFDGRGDAFRADKPRPWAEGRVAFRGPARMFDLHPDGNRVVLAAAPSRTAPESSQLDKIVLVLNFFEDLRRIASK